MEVSANCEVIRERTCNKLAALECVKEREGRAHKRVHEYVDSWPCIDDGEVNDGLELQLRNLEPGVFAGVSIGAGGGLLVKIVCVLSVF